MKRNRFTESQIVRVLKESESGVLVAEPCRKHGINSTTYYIDYVNIFLLMKCACRFFIQIMIPVTDNMTITKPSTQIKIRYGNPNTLAICSAVSQVVTVLPLYWPLGSNANLSSPELASKNILVLPRLS